MNQKLGKLFLPILFIISISGAIGGSSAFAIYYVLKHKNNDTKHKGSIIPKSANQNKETKSNSIKATKLNKSKPHKKTDDKTIIKKYTENVLDAKNKEIELNNNIKSNSIKATKINKSLPHKKNTGNALDNKHKETTSSKQKNENSSIEEKSHSIKATKLNKSKHHKKVDDKKIVSKHTNNISINKNPWNKKWTTKTKHHSEKTNKNNNYSNKQKESNESKNNFINNNLPTTIDQLKNMYPSYYGSLNTNSKGQNLFNALNKIQQKYRNGVGRYKALWKTYQVFEDKYDEKDGTLYDIYSEKIGKKDDFNFKIPENQDNGNHKKPGDTYNREHLIPQSIFGTTAHIHNDAHFVFPTDSSINGYRSNFPHDEVTNVSKSGHSLGGNDWKLGKGKNSGQTSFEPDDNFKGDIARAYLYFMLTWHNFPIGNKDLTRYLPFTNYFPFFKQNYLDTYIKWSNNDPVSKFEIYTNNGIAKREGGLRNPFIDMPKLIDLIWA